MIAFEKEYSFSFLDFIYYRQHQYSHIPTRGNDSDWLL